MGDRDQFFFYHRFLNANLQAFDVDPLELFDPGYSIQQNCLHADGITLAKGRETLSTKMFKTLIYSNLCPIWLSRKGGFITNVLKSAAKLRVGRLQNTRIRVRAARLLRVPGQ